VTARVLARFGLHRLFTSPVTENAMRTSLLLPLFGVLAVTTACSSGGTIAATGQETAHTAIAGDSVLSMLVGTWDLVRGCGGFAYGCRTPEQLQEPLRYVFRANRTVTAFSNGKELFTASFTISPGAAEGSGDTRALLSIGGGPTVDPRPLRVSITSADSLVLDEGCCDRFAFEYRRVR
jgi:hypothetical protein